MPLFYLVCLFLAGFTGVACAEVGQPRTWSFADAKGKTWSLAPGGSGRDLLVLAGELSEEEAEAAWYLHDFAHEQFRVHLVLGKGAAQPASHGPVHSLIQGPDPGGETKYFLVDEALQVVVSGEGIPSRKQLASWSMAGRDLAAQGPLGFILGQDGSVLQKHRNDCGVAVTLMMAQRRGLPLARDQVYGKLDPGPAGSHLSLLDLKRYLETHQLASSAWRGKAENLQRETTPVLLHLDQAHFVLLVYLDDDAAWIIDPKLGRQVIHRDHFDLRWTGAYFRLDGPS